MARGPSAREFLVYAPEQRKILTLGQSRKILENASGDGYRPSSRARKVVKDGSRRCYGADGSRTKFLSVKIFVARALVPCRGLAVLPRVGVWAHFEQMNDQVQLSGGC